MAEHATLITALKKGPLRVAVVGSGNWGTAVGKLIAENCAESYIFEEEVKLWVNEEVVEGVKLSEKINADHVNVKYLPGIKLPTNLVAEPDLVAAVDGADLLVFVLPHQFLTITCRKLVGNVKEGAKAISLVKGIIVDHGNLRLCSNVITSTLGIDCSVLSGANVAKDVAAEHFSETTIGYSDRLSATIWQQLFDTIYFKVNCVPDPHGVELCGSVKNIIALSAGFCDGLGYGTNTKAAIMRIGVEELRKFAAVYYDGILEETFFDSAGYADVITTCWGGRNVRCAKEFVTREGKSSWDEIENDLLNGQKLQGHLACKDVYEVIAAHQLQDKFPLFTVTYRIAFEKVNPSELLTPFQVKQSRPIKLPEECNVCLKSPEMIAARKVISSDCVKGL